MKRPLALASSLVLASSLGLAACGGSGSSEPAETVPAGALVVTAIPTLRFDAAEYGPVKAGEVTFGYVNNDSVRHTLIIAKDGTKVPNFKLIIGKKGDVDSGSVTLEAGNYDLLCDVPGHGAMKATLTVE